MSPPPPHISVLAKTTAITCFILALISGAVSAYYPVAAQTQNPQQNPEPQPPEEPDPPDPPPASTESFVPEISAEEKPVTAQQSGNTGTPITALSDTGCTDGTFVDLTANPRVAGSNNDLAEDCQALVAIQNAWAGEADNNSLPSDHFLRTWGTSTNQKIDTWEGISTSVFKRVSRLALASKNITGSIPAEINDLTGLSYINFYNNSISGQIPTISSLTGLRNLHLHFLQLSGNIPDLSSLTNLRELTISDNNLSGQIPSLAALTNLRVLQASRNQLSGQVPDISSLSNLQRLYFADNQLSMGIPDFSDLTSLQDVKLSRNQFTGQIPDLTKLTSLQHLSLEGNRLSGNIPDLTKLTSLQNLYLSSNNLSGQIPDLTKLVSLENLYLSNNGLSGNIPDLSKLVSLQRLYFQNNQLSGEIPALSALTNLRNLRLENNQLSGEIPALSALTNLRDVRLQDNQLSGQIPALSALTNLIRLNLSNNGLSGELPALSALTNLQSLFLRNNQLSGGISNISSLTSLSLVRLDNNLFSGQIPDLSTLTNLTWLLLSNNQLSGQIPSSLGGLSQLTHLWLDSNELTGEIPQGLTSLLPAPNGTGRIRQIKICMNKLTGSVPAALRSSILTDYPTSEGYDPVACQRPVIDYTPPTGLKVVAGATLDINASGYATHTGHTVSCGAAKDLHDKLSSVTRPDEANKPCEYRIAAKASATAGNATFEIPYTSTSGAKLDATVTVAVSNIAFTAPNNLSVAAGSTLTVPAGSYATDGTFAITCSAATGVSSEFTSANNTGDSCDYTVTAKTTASAGPATFTVPYNSAGGDTHDGEISITITAISYTAPQDLKVVAGATLDINAATYASHTGFNIDCGAAKDLNDKLTSVTRPDAAGKPCEYQIAAKAAATAGNATFTIPYTSTSGAKLDATVTVAVSNIAFTAPDNLSVAAGSTLTVPAGSYATDGAFAITCSAATGISSEFTSANNTGNSCDYTVTAKTTASAGPATFTVPYNSAGGDTHQGEISITITAISYTAPQNLKVVAGATLDINASTYASHTGFNIDCGAAKDLHNKLTSVTRPDPTAKPCEYQIAAKSEATAGNATFTIPYTSTSGAKLDATVTVAVSNIAFTAPNNLSVAAGSTLTVPAGSYATDGAFAITCSAATGVSSEFTSANNTGDSCDYTVTAKATAAAGAASFTVPYNSAGGDTHQGEISITITAISYTAPQNLKVVAGATLDINASTYASHTGFNIDCGAAKDLNDKLTSVTRPDAAGKPCEYQIAAKSAATAGNATFTIPYTSTSGAKLDATVTVAVSNIAFTAPNNLSVAAGRTLTVPAGSYATDGAFAITCSAATGVSSEFTSANNTGNSCDYTVTAKATAAAGAASFTVPYNSAGGDTHQGEISITITAISYSAPQDLKVVAGATLDINASTYASHTGFNIDCGAAKDLSAKITSVTRPDAAGKPCEYQIAAKATATAGNATFTIPYTSTSGAKLDATVTVAVSNIAFTAPDNLSVAAGSTLSVPAGSYATDGAFAITCSAATGVSSEFTSANNTGDSCDYTVTAKATAAAGAASFTVPYNSAGGDTHQGEVSITITAISYTAPQNLKVAAGATLDINAATYATHTGFNIDCGTAKDLNDKITSVTRPDPTAKPCEYQIAAKSAATAGNATFTIPYTSTSGAKLDATVTVAVSNIAFTAPDNLSVAAGRTLTVPAGSYATDGAFAITCSAATGISSEFTSANNTGNSCDYTVTAKTTAAAGTASFTVPYNSAGGDTHDGEISITITAISYTAPQNLKVVAGATLDINASTYASHTGFNIDCGTAKDLNDKLTSVTRPDPTAKPCEYQIAAKATATAGNATFTIPYTSTSGAVLDATVTVAVSNIAFTAPDNLSVAAGRTLTVPAGSYATDGTFAITCSAATGISSEFTSANNTGNSCDYTVTAKATATAGPATFTVPYNSAGGDTHQGEISITITAITYTAPQNLKVAAGATLDINASTYATHTGFNIDCGTAKDLNDKLTSVTRPDPTAKPCEYQIAAKTTATAGNATFTIPYTSSSGAVLDATVTVAVSNIAFTAPDNLSVAAGRTLTVPAGSYATDGAFAITCSAATGISSEFTSANNTGNSCDYTVTAKTTAAAGTASFTVPYNSAGGDTHDGEISITITAISYTAPQNLKVAAGATLDINASTYASHTGFNIDCGTAKDLNDKLTSVTRPDPTAKPCEYQIAAKTTATAGNATFTIPYTSSSGAVLDATVTVAVSNIAFTAPDNLSVAAGRTLTVPAGSYATDGTFAITCSAATGISSEFTSANNTGNSCDYTVTAKATATAGPATFTVPYNSAGGDTHQGEISITITAITYTAPQNLKVAAGATLDINASTYASHTGFNIDCGTAKDLNDKLTSVTRPDPTAKPCEYQIAAKTTATAGNATFTIPYTSTSGAVLDATVTVAVSNIAFTAPDNLSVAAGRTLTVPAGSYATDGAFAITCSAATGISSEFTSANNTGNSCDYTVTAKTTAAAGTASFTVPYNSAGGDTHDGEISITITAISYTAPQNLKVAAGATLDINASTYASHTGFNIDCGTAKDLNDKLTSVTRPDPTAKPCEYQIAAKATATAGNATFTIPYTSTSGAVLDATVTVAVSNIAFTAPDNLSVAAGRTLTVPAGSYATDGTFAITCSAATGISSEFTSANNTGNSCDYTVTAKTTATAGPATFTVPYNSAGGDTHQGEISITITAITYTAPQNLKVAAGATLDINASTYASHTGFNIDCGTAKDLNDKLTSVTRPDPTAKPCEYQIAAKTTATAGNATFTIPYTSSSGAVLDATVTVAVSNIAFTAPDNLSVAAGRTLTVPAGSYATDGTFAITCSAATGISSEFTSANNTGNSCDYTVTAKTTATAGPATFTVPYNSAGGDTHQGEISITITAISYTAPQNLKVAAGATLDINASTYASHTGFNIDCGTAKDLNDKLTSVTRPDPTAKPCEYQIAAKATATAGNATFTIPYTSTSGAVLDATVTVAVSNIAFTAPDNLSVAAGRTLTVPAGSYATDGTFAITCSAATGISSEFTSANNTGNSCDYTVTAKTTATAGPATFTVPYNSAGGDTHQGEISITITAISYTAPQNLKVAAGATLDINASTYATHTGFNIDCGTAKDLNDKLTSVTRPDPTAKPCEYQIAAKAAATAGNATFEIPYTSTSGAVLDATVTVAVSNIAFTAPDNLSMQAGGTLTLPAGSYAADGAFAITCSAATGVSSEFTSANNTGDSCDYTVTAKTTASAGPASFTVPYNSAGGDTHQGEITITIVPAPQRPETQPQETETPPEQQPDPPMDPDQDSPPSESPEPPNEPPTDPPADPPNDPPTETPAEPPTDTPAEPPTDTPNEPPTETPNEPPTETPADTPTEPPAESPTEPLTDTSNDPPTEPNPVPVAFRPWNFFAVRQGGADQDEIREAFYLFPGESIWWWSQDRQIWIRHPRATANLPDKMTIAFRTATELENDEIEALNLSSTRSKKLLPIWSILSSPDDIRRSDTGTSDSYNLIDSPTRTVPDSARSFVLTDRLTNCEADEIILAIARYDPDTQAFSIWLPCHPEMEARYTQGTGAVYRRLTFIARYDPIYVCLMSRNTVSLAWNPETQIYQPARTTSPQTVQFLTMLDCRYETPNGSIKMRIVSQDTPTNEPMLVNR